MSRSSTILEEYRARKGDTLITMELITGAPGNYIPFTQGSYLVKVVELHRFHSESECRRYYQKRTGTIKTKKPQRRPPPRRRKVEIQVEEEYPDYQRVPDYRYYNLYR